MNIRSLHQISRAVVDLDAAVRFYGDMLGLPLIARFDQGPKLAFLDLFGTRLMLEQGQSAPEGVVVYLGVEDIEEAVAELRANGADVVSEPHLIHHDADGTFGPAGESEFMAFVRDPSGNLIALVQRKNQGSQ